MKPRADHHLSRTPDGWLIRVMRGRVLSQRFVSRARGIEAARALRDELLAGLPALAEAQRPIAHKRPRSNTGKVGLSYTVERRGGHEVIKATVRVGRNATKGRTFFLTTFGGYEAALEAAEEWRESCLAARRETNAR